MVKQATPNSQLFLDMVKAFAVGGIICVIGQLITDFYIGMDIGKEDASALTSASLIFIGALLQGLGYTIKLQTWERQAPLCPSPDLQTA